MYQNPEVLVWAGVHGEEVEPGIPLVRSLQTKPIPGVEGDIAHPKAVEAGLRKLEVNLALCMKRPELFPGTIESSLVPGIRQRSAAARRVIDIHQLQPPAIQEDYAFVGPCVRKDMLGFIALTGIKRILISDFGLQGIFDHAVLVDVARTSPRNDVGYWREILAKTAAGAADEMTLSFENTTLLRHANVSTRDRKRLGLMGTAYEPGQEIPGADKLYDINLPVHALFGWAADWADEVEVAAPVDINKIRYADNIVYMPTLVRSHDERGN